MKQAISRKVEQTPEMEIACMFGMVYSLPRFEECADVIAVFPGMGEIWRPKKAVSLWNDHPDTRFMLIARANPTETIHTELTLETLREKPFNVRRTKGVILSHPMGNTLDQAEWIAEKVVELGIISITMTLPPYHLMRAILTLLRSFNKRGIRIPILPAPIALSLEEAIPETGVSSWEMFPGEYERIKRYQKQGDVASLSELREYLAWLWKEPVFRLESQY